MQFANGTGPLPSLSPSELEFSRALARSPRQLLRAVARGRVSAAASSDALSPIELRLWEVRAHNACGDFFTALELATPLAGELAQGEQFDKVAQLLAHTVCAYIYLGDLPSARHALASSLAVPQANAPVTHTWQVWAEGLVARHAGDFTQAAEEFKRARQQWLELGETWNAARCARELGHTYSRVEPRHALEILRASKAEFQTERADYESAICDLLLGHCFYELGVFSEAFVRVRHARRVFLKSNLPFFAASCDLELGVTHWRKNELDAAKNALTRARDSFARQKVESEASSAEMNLGLVLLELHAYPQALAQFQAAGEHAQRTGQRRKVAFCLMNQGWTYAKQARFAEALNFYARARAEFTREGLRLHIARYCDVNEALVYLELGLLERARRVLTDAHAIFIQEQLQPELAECEMLLAQIWNGEGNLEQANACLEHARKLYAQIGQEVYRARGGRELARLAVRRLNLRRAERVLDSSDRVFAKRQLSTDLAQNDIVRGELFLAKGETERAAARFQAALRAFNGTPSESVWQAHYGLGRVAKTRGQLQRALRWHAQAADEIAALRAELVTEEWSNAFFNLRQEVVRDALALAARQKNGVVALQMIEGAKARILLGALARRDWRPNASSNSAREQLLVREAALRAELLKHSPASSNSPAEKSARRSRASEYEHVVEQLRIDTNGLKGAPLLARFSLEKFRAAANARWQNWAAVNYYLDGQTLYRVFLDAECVQVEATILSARELFVLQQCADSNPDLRERLYRSSVRGFTVPDFSQELMTQAAALLLPRRVLEERSELTLLISPHGLLHQIPFHALRAGNQYLIQHITFLYTPALEAWTELLTPVHHSKQELLLFGLNEFGQAASPLKFTETEAARLAAVFGGRAFSFWQAEATRAKVLALNSDGKLQKFALLHFATHAVLNADAPHWSRILLADAPLTTADILNLDLDAALVTLSACSSALGKGGTGDEWVAFTRAFFYAGARSVVASLWAVEDEIVSVELMARFYAKLRRGASISNALRGAQIEALEQGFKPYHWAPFVLVGCG